MERKWLGYARAGEGEARRGKKVLSAGHPTKYYCFLFQYLLRLCFKSHLYGVGARLSRSWCCFVIQD